MKIIRLTKRLISRIARKRRQRRDRPKGMHAATQHGRNWQTPAQRLVDSYYTGRFYVKQPPTGVGVARAAKRLKEHRKKFRHIPYPTTMSRQVRRRLELKGL